MPSSPGGRRRRPWWGAVLLGALLLAVLVPGPAVAQSDEPSTPGVWVVMLPGGKVWVVAFFVEPYTSGSGAVFDLNGAEGGISVLIDAGGRDLGSWTAETPPRGELPTRWAVTGDPGSWAFLLFTAQAGGLGGVGVELAGSYYESLGSIGAVDAGTGFTAPDSFLELGAPREVPAATGVADLMARYGIGGFVRGPLLGSDGEGPVPLEPLEVVATTQAPTATTQAPTSTQAAETATGGSNGFPFLVVALATIVLAVVAGALAWWWSVRGQGSGGETGRGVGDDGGVKVPEDFEAAMLADQGVAAPQLVVGENAPGGVIGTGGTETARAARAESDLELRAEYRGDEEVAGDRDAPDDGVARIGVSYRWGGGGPPSAGTDPNETPEPDGSGVETSPVRWFEDPRLAEAIRRLGWRGFWPSDDLGADLVKLSRPLGPEDEFPTDPEERARWIRGRVRWRLEQEVELGGCDGGELPDVLRLGDEVPREVERIAQEEWSSIHRRRELEETLEEIEAGRLPEAESLEGEPAEPVRGGGSGVGPEDDGPEEDGPDDGDYVTTVL